MAMQYLYAKLYAMTAVKNLAAVPERACAVFEHFRAKIAIEAVRHKLQRKDRRDFTGWNFG
jgi:hypothetical protein